MENEKSKCIDIEEHKRKMFHILNATKRVILKMYKLDERRISRLRRRKWAPSHVLNLYYDIIEYMKDLENFLVSK